MRALLYAAAALTGVWGVAHLFATRGVVAGFGELTADNGRIITMEWIVEGVALVSLASLVAAVTAVDATTAVSSAAYAVAVATLLVLALVSLVDRLPGRLPALPPLPLHLHALRGADRSGRLAVTGCSVAGGGAPNKRIVTRQGAAVVSSSRTARRLCAVR